MPTNCKQRQFEFIFPAALENVDTACLKLRQFLSEVGLEACIFETELLTREALINAVTHGNDMNKEKMVEFRVTIAGNELEIEVQDEGPGFDWKSRGAKIAALSDDNGRGIMIFNNYAAEIKYNEKGNKITLQKTIL